MDIVERLNFDAARSRVELSEGIATNIEEAADEIKRLRAAGEAFRAAVIQSGALNHVSQNLYIDKLRAFEAALQSQQKEDHARSCDLLNGGIKCSCKV